MYNIIQHSHSGIMWLAVIMLILSVLFSFIKIIKKDDIISSGLLKLYYLTKWILYLQAILGIVLLFISPKVIYDKGYLKFGEWAESGGQDYADWYKDLYGYRDNAYLDNQ